MNDGLNKMANEKIAKDACTEKVRHKNVVDGQASGGNSAGNGTGTVHGTEQNPGAAQRQGTKRRPPWFYPAIILVCLFAGFAVSNVLNEQAEKSRAKGFRNANYAPAVEKDHALLLQFQADHPECAKVLRACEEDVTDDGRKDLIVVYRTTDKLTRMVVCMNDAGGVAYSEPIPAPIENQQVQFKNIDKEAEIEFIVSGEKNGAVGYAIYRMIDGQPADLFGDGMEDCC